MLIFENAVTVGRLLHHQARGDDYRPGFAAHLQL